MVVPLLFQLGVLTLLVQLATIRPRQLPAWAPSLMLIGFATFAINLNLLPAGAFLILLALAPLRRRGSAVQAPAGIEGTGVGQ